MPKLFLFFSVLTNTLLCFCVSADSTVDSHYYFTEKYINTFRTIEKESREYIPEVLNEYPQETNDSSGIRSAALSRYVETFSIDELQKIIDERDSAYKENLFGIKEYDSYLYNEKLWVSIFEKILFERLKVIYGDGPARIIMAPLVVRVKIFGEEIEPYQITPDEKIGLHTVNTQVEDVLKGDSHFTKGDTLKFYYLPVWFPKPGPGFIITRSYLISLTPISENNERRLALRVNDVNNGIVLIDDEMVLDDQNYFGIGTVTWNEFKTRIIQMLHLD